MTHLTKAVVVMLFLLAVLSLEPGTAAAQVSSCTKTSGTYLVIRGNCASIASATTLSCSDGSTYLISMEIHDTVCVDPGPVIRRAGSG